MLVDDPDIRKYYYGLEATHSRQYGNEEHKMQELPSTLQNLPEEMWPLIMTYAHFLQCIDKTIASPFFAMEEEVKNGEQRPCVDSVDKQVEAQLGWDEEESSITKATRDRAAVINKKNNVLDYNYFVKKIWPQMIKSNANNKEYCTKYHPALVYTEIISFIKGTKDAVEDPNECLSLDACIHNKVYPFVMRKTLFSSSQKDQLYCASSSDTQLGKKISPMFNGDRSEIYALYKSYEEIKISLGVYDKIGIPSSSSYQ